MVRVLQTEIKKKTISNLQSQFAKQPNWLTPEKVETRQSGVKGNFYAPFLGEGKQATAFSYPTLERESEQSLSLILLRRGRASNRSFLFNNILDYLYFSLTT